MNKICNVLVVLYICLLTIFVLTTLRVVNDIKDIVQRAEYEEAMSSYQQAPERCARYYNNGTDDWINCMGVGYVN